jgi:hypothetical protein
MGSLFKSFFSRSSPSSSSRRNRSQPDPRPASEGLSRAETRCGDAPRVYLAGRFERREELCAIARELQLAGWTVTSSWLFTDSSLGSDALACGGRATEIAAMDLRDLRQAELCISFTEHPGGPLGRGGRHFELGAATVLGLRTLLVGPREHVFHCLDGMERCASWAEARERLGLASPPVQVATAAPGRLGDAVLQGS